MTDRENVIIDLNTAKIILCYAQTLTPEMCVRIGQTINSVIDLLKEQKVVVIPHRNYQYLSDYWCECGWHLGKKGDVKFCPECGRKVKWDD